MRSIPLGNIDDIMSGKVGSKDDVYNFIRVSREVYNSGACFVAMGIFESGMVWLYASDSKEEIERVLQETDAIEAEILELHTLN